MAKLPFVVAPRIKPVIERVGNEECGILEIERRGYVTAGEKAFVDSQMTEDDTTRGVVSLCRKIAIKFKCDMQEAYEAITEIITTGVKSKIASKAAAEFEDDINQLVGEMMQSDQKRKLVQAYAILVHRVDADFSVDDLTELDPNLINEIAAFYTSEELKSSSKLTQAFEAEGGENEIEALEKK